MILKFATNAGTLTDLLFRHQDPLIIQQLPLRDLRFTKVLFLVKLSGECPTCAFFPSQLRKQSYTKGSEREETLECLGPTFQGRRVRKGFSCEQKRKAGQLKGEEKRMVPD